MTHLELIDVLSECAESPYFGNRNLFLPYKKARKLALMLVQPSHQVHYDVISEKDSSYESSLCG